MHACTIVAKNYAAHARVLARSFREHHPEGTFTVLVLDELDGRIDPADEPFEIITPFEIGCDEFPVLAGTYDVLELSTAVKPWLLRTLLDRHGDHVVYLDPDIRIHRSLEFIADLAREHHVVLTPHNIAPMPRDGRRPSETDILIAGAYNLGFIALGDDAPARRLLDWWAERLRTDCIVDPDRGYFVDQRWIDLVPGMVPEVEVLRDPGCNVAYWNLATRDVQGDAEHGWKVNGSPLAFFHFSGYDPRRPERLSKHQDRIDLDVLPVVRDLCDRYGAELLEQGLETCIDWPYTYARTPGGIVLDKAARRLYARGIKEGALGAPLFEAAGEAAFVVYALEPEPGGADPLITRYMAAVHDTRPDLQAAFPTFSGLDAQRLRRWFYEDGWESFAERRALLPEPPPPADPAGPPPRNALRLPRLDPIEAPFGVNLVGYLQAELGVGEVARQVVGALDAADVPVLPLRMTAHASRQGHEFAARDALESPFAVNLLCVNADVTPAVAEAAGERFFAGRHTIGWWWWEVASFPDFWLHAFDYLDEVWAGSHFVAEALAKVSTVPVTRIPMPVALERAPAPDRAALGLPEDAFVYLFAFDHNSVMERKNPLGLVEAHRRAYPEPADDVRLVVKTINGDAHPEDRAALVAAAADRPDVLVLDRYLDAQLKDALTASCDCYVSLHRSEGFGIGMAEAALMGKPVVATGYGGNMDWMGPPGGWLVDHALVPIGPGHDPYPADGAWADPDLDHAATLLRAVREQPEEAARRVAAARAYLAEHHSPEAVGAVMRSRLQSAATKSQPDQLGEEGALALHAAREVLRRGPARWPHAPSDPRRFARAAAIRAAKPMLAVQREAQEHLAWAAETLHAAAQDEIERRTALLEAQLLRAARDDGRREARIAELEARLAALEEGGR